MAELVTAATILVGSGAGGWLVDKLLGPSFEALGQQFRAFAGERISTIFGAAEAKLKQQDVDALPPGFALRFLQNASLADEDDSLTESWANLLVGASKNFSNKHTTYVDILAQLQGEEVRLLDVLVGDFSSSASAEPVAIEQLVRRGLQRLPHGASEFIAWVESVNRDGTFAPSQRVGWPIKVSAYAYLSVSEQIVPTHIVWGASRDMLERQALVRHFKVPCGDLYVEGYYPTALGLSFVKACRGTTK